MRNDQGFFISYFSSSFPRTLPVRVTAIGVIYTLPTNFCIKWALFLHGASFHICHSVQLHRGNNAADDKLSDRPEHASGGGCREVILIVLGLRTSVRTHMFM